LTINSYIDWHVLHYLFNSIVVSKAFLPSRFDLTWYTHLLPVLLVFKVDRGHLLGRISDDTS
jgi:hypothetical protein